jgi:nicotinate-nucleotide pyrophosphorylase (carboxylating)
MTNDFAQIEPDEELRRAVHRLAKLGFEEDLGKGLDLTSTTVVPEGATGSCEIRTRADGITAGLTLVPWVLEVASGAVAFVPLSTDGRAMRAGETLGTLTGRVRDLLAVERLILNIVSRLCGVATLTAQYVSRLEGLPCRLYDTRKTTAGWRRLEKYAVRCGGGYNHRTGLFDAYLIKDNHLAMGNLAMGGGTERTLSPSLSLSPSEAVRRAKASRDKASDNNNAKAIIEVEVDTLTQFEDAMLASPDIILLDNFSLADLSSAVERRQQLDPNVQLEASGGITLDTIRKIGETGVDRISCGAITHQAVWLDLGLDWLG